MLVQKKSVCRPIEATVLAAGLLIGIPGSATAAAGYANSQINFVRVDKSGKGYVVLVQAPTGTVAACRDTTYSKHLAFDTNTPGGRAILALALPGGEGVRGEGVRS